MSAEEYRRNADTCINLAEQVRDTSAKASMMAMAAAWTRLAVQADKNQTNDIVYETTPAPTVQMQMQQWPQQMQQQQQQATKKGG